MANVIVKPFKCCVRAIIQFLNKKGIEPRKIHWRLCAVYGQGNVMAECNEYQWVEKFNKGQTTTHDKDQSGQPSTAVNKEMVNIVHAILKERPSLTLDDSHHKMATRYSYENCNSFGVI